MFCRRCGSVDKESLAEQLRTKDLEDRSIRQEVISSLDRQLDRLGRGTGRVVWDVNGYVLKLATDLKGTWQNETEWEWSKKTSSPYFAPVLKEPYDEWFIFMSRTKSFDKSRFESTVGVPWGTFADWLTHMAYGGDWGQPPDPSYEIIEDIRAWGRFVGAVQEYADLRHTEQWGFKWGQPMLIDYGLG